MSEIWKVPDDVDTGAIKEEFREFLRDDLNVDEGRVLLEDIYTPIDRCLADNLAFKNIAKSELLNLRNKIDYLISLGIQNRFRTGPAADSTYVPKLADNLVKQAAVRAIKATGVTDKKEQKNTTHFQLSPSIGISFWTMRSMKRCSIATAK